MPFKEITVGKLFRHAVPMQDSILYRRRNNSEQHPQGRAEALDETGAAYGIFCFYLDDEVENVP